jgi:hypothetical protein
MATVGYGCVSTQRRLSGVYGATPPHRHNGRSLSARQQCQSSTYKYAGRQAFGSTGSRTCVNRVVLVLRELRSVRSETGQQRMKREKKVVLLRELQ